MKNRYTIITDKVKEGFRIVTSSTVIIEAVRNKNAILLGANSLPPNRTKSEKGNPVTMRFVKFFIPTVELSISVVTEVSSIALGRGLN
jgi:hypothetical protein